MPLDNIQQQAKTKNSSNGIITPMQIVVNNRSTESEVNGTQLERERSLAAERQQWALNGILNYSNA